jgi:hypothetical protein
MTQKASLQGMLAEISADLDETADSFMQSLTTDHLVY